MYRKPHNGQISIEEFPVPFGGTLDPENRWVFFSTLLPSDEIEEAYVHQLTQRLGLLQSLHAWRLARCSLSSDLA
jgi:hypothetical protein